jgi:hypothetical protein
MTYYAMPPTPSGVDEEAWRAAVSAIRGYCGWHIAPVVTEDIKVDGSGGGLLLLPTRFLSNVTGVINDDVVVLDEDVHWSPRGTVRIANRGTWTLSTYGSVQMTITHGYEDFPPEVLAVARSLAKNGDGSPGGKLTSGPHSVELSAAAMAGAGSLSAAHERALRRYRIGVEL